MILRDRSWLPESKLEFGIKLEELRAKGLAAMLMGDVTTDRTQAVIASSAADTWAFTAASPSQGADVFYDILQGGVQPYGLTSVALVAASTGNAAFTTSGNLFTKAAHGLVAGQPVRLGTTCGTNLGTSTTFYLVNVTVNTFQLASAAGGTALTGPADVATTTITPQLVDDVSCKIDLELGRVRFLYPMVSTVTATIVAPAIDTFTNPTLLMKQVTPLTKPTQIGWARMVVFDNGAVVGEYGPFKAQITTKGGSGWDATKAAQYDLTISVLEIPGTFGVRNV